MSVPNPRIRFTYEDYRTLPEDSGKRYELLDGELLMSPAPTPLHQRIVRDLGFLLWQHCRATGVGEILEAPIDVVLGRGDGREVVQPDILFIGQQRRGIIGAGEIEDAPDLVVEVLSPGSEERDRGYKKTLYGRYGVREYWIVDPEARQLERYRLEASGLVLMQRLAETDTVTSELLPGLAIRLNDVFPA